jgi:hypothetical protein
MFHDVWVTNIVGLNLKLFSKIAQHFCFFFFFFGGGGGWTCRGLLLYDVVIC